MKPNHVQNKSVDPSWGQLLREVTCSIRGHVFYVAWGDGYLGMPQSHCYRCGCPCPYGYKGDDWVPPIG